MDKVEHELEPFLRSIFFYFDIYSPDSEQLFDLAPDFRMESVHLGNLIFIRDEPYIFLEAVSPNEFRTLIKGMSTPTVIKWDNISAIGIANDNLIFFRNNAREN